LVFCAWDIIVAVIDVSRFVRVCCLAIGGNQSPWTRCVRPRAYRYCYNNRYISLASASRAPSQERKYLGDLGVLRIVMGQERPNRYSWRHYASYLHVFRSTATFASSLISRFTETIRLRLEQHLFPQDRIHPTRCP